MPLDQTIRSYIEQNLTLDLPPRIFESQLDVIFDDIIDLLARSPNDAPPTSAFLAYQISFLLMRSSNQARQARYAYYVTELLRRNYNERGVINVFVAAPRAQSLAVLVNIYNFHHALLMNGLRSGDGATTLDAFDALRMLQNIVVAAIGPWHAHVQLSGAISEYHHARADISGGGAQIEIGRFNRGGRSIDLQVATWNLQGSSASTDHKWHTSIFQLARRNHVIVLQEAGTPPASCRHLEEMHIIDQFGGEHEVNHYIWAMGTSRKPRNYQVFVLDVQRLRVNLAIIVADAAPLTIQSVMVVADGVPRDANAFTSRPVLGLRLRLNGMVNDVVVANLHAISGGGPNAPRILREVSWHSDVPYVLLGDFNRDPRQPDAQQANRGNWVSPPDIAQVVLANGNTHPSVAPVTMLDYAICNGTAGPTNLGTVSGMGQSDHLAVSYIFNFHQ